MHIYRLLIQFFIWEQCPFLNFEIWRKWKTLLKQLVSTTPLKPLNRIAWNFVVMRDKMCRYAFLQEMLIWSFWGAIYIPFFFGLPVTNAWNCHSLYTAFSSNVGTWGMWACSLFLSFFFVIARIIMFMSKIKYICKLILPSPHFFWLKIRSTRLQIGVALNGKILIYCRF